MPFNRYVQLTSSVLLSTILLTGCYSPERVTPVQASDSSLDCSQIQQEIQYAEQAKASAREHDRFEFRYLLVVPAFVSAYNFHKAEKAADERKANLEQLYASKNCAYQPQSQQPMSYESPYGQPGMEGMTPGMEGMTPPGGMGQPPMMPGMPGGEDYPESSPYGYPPQGMPGR